MSEFMVEKDFTVYFASNVTGFVTAIEATTVFLWTSSPQQMGYTRSIKKSETTDRENQTSVSENQPNRLEKKGARPEEKLEGKPEK